MRRSLKVALVLTLLATVALTGCNKLKARDELNKGVRAYKGGQFEDAIEHFRRAIELDPELTNARVYLATAYASQFVPGAPSEENKEMGRKAIEEFKKVLEMEPDNTTALSYIASIYFGMEEFEQAKEFRRKLIEVDPNDPENYYSIGVIDWSMAYQPRMKKKRELGLRPDEPLPPRVRRDLREQNEEIVDEGITMLKKAIELNPKYVDAVAYLNLMYREKADLSPPQEREKYLELADQMFERQKRLREQLEREEAEEAAATAS